MWSVLNRKIKKANEPRNLLGSVRWGLAICSNLGVQRGGASQYGQPWEHSGVYGAIHILDGKILNA